jgi:general L-amino acid transport system permease protein
MTAETRQTRPPIWRDIRVLRVALQVLVVGLLAVVGYVLWFNLTNNMKRAGLSTGFDFLTQPLGVDIAGSDLSSTAPVWRGLLVGIKNTFALVIVGIPLLTILGLVVGVARLSSNWLVARAAALYVEILRNLPPLLIIFFVFNAVILRLPRLEDSWTILDLFIVNNRFVAMVSFTTAPGFGAFWLVMGVAILGAIWVWIWRTRREEKTGAKSHRGLWAGGLILVVAVVAYLALGYPIRLSFPRLDGRALEGGFSGLTAYFAVLAALVLYTASHVAEIVRGSIQAVPKGQSEAADSLALSPFQKLRHVTLPQAMRIAIPPVISQYLNFTKNTSLAIAVGYAEITRITFQTIGNGQPAPQLIAILMACYLVFSLTISLVVNILNRRFRYVTR